MKHQQNLLDLINKKLPKHESLAQAISTVLDISMDAAYRRCRNDAMFSIEETALLCQHFQLSGDELFDMRNQYVRFQSENAAQSVVHLEDFVDKLHQNLQALLVQSDSHLTFTVNNTPMLQMLNFPHLLRAKLFFWFKNHLHQKNFNQEKLRKTEFSSFNLEKVKACLDTYNSISTTEIYDTQLLYGFAQELIINYHMGNIANKSYLNFLLTELHQMIKHLELQASYGRKMIVNAKPYEIGAEVQFLHNPVLNATTIFYYKTASQQGVFLAHNYLSSIHTQDEDFVHETSKTIESIISHSVVISKNNPIGRKKFFDSVRKQISQVKSQV